VARYAGQSVATPALEDVSLQLDDGQRLLLLGPNGAGKSTFIRIFAGLMRPTRGQALVDGRPARSVRHQVGVVSHVTFLYEELSALENLDLYAALYNVTDAGSRALTLLDQVGLPHVAHERVGHLSRGQQQRVTIARALLHDPRLLLLDEPDTGLDAAAFDVLEALIKQPGRTVVLTTHNLSAGLRLGTRVAVLAHGRVVHEQQSISRDDASELGVLLQRLAAA
jgi:heme exporter protein A